MAYKDPENTLILETTKGNVVIELLPDLAPVYAGERAEVELESRSEPDRLGRPPRPLELGTPLRMGEDRLHCAPGEPKQEIRKGRHAGAERKLDEGPAGGRPETAPLVDAEPREVLCVEHVLRPDVEPKRDPLRIQERLSLGHPLDAGQSIPARKHRVGVRRRSRLAPAQ